MTGLLCSLALAPVSAMERPYRVSLVGDAFDGTAWTTGVKIELDEGWKTYWRMPGEAGIPPDFTWKSSVPADIEVLYPVPARYEDASGETVGYKHEVVLPVTVKAGSATQVKLDLTLFFAVCRDICIPATAETSIGLTAAMRDPSGVEAVERAMAAVPKPGTGIEKVEAVSMAGKTVLRLALAQPVDDIFVESGTSAYFHAPRFEADGMQALIEAGNIDDPAKLAGQELKFTYSRNGQGLEQSLRPP